MKFNYSIKGQILASFIIVISVTLTHAQDIIQTKSGEEIKAKVVMVSDTLVMFKHYDNIMGPMQRIKGNDLVAITFTNGEVKRYVPLPVPMDRMVEPIEKFKVENKNPSVLWEYQFMPEFIFAGSSIQYYGLDMAKLVYLDASKVGDESMKEYLPKWYQRFDRGMKETMVKRGLQNAHIVMNTERMQFRHELIDADWIKSEWNGMSITEVKERIGKLVESLNEKNGTGFVIMLDYFNNSTNKAGATFVFFELGTGALLWVSKVEGDAKEREMVDRWGLAMIRMYQQFRLAVYQPTHSTYFKDKYSDDN